MLGRVVHNRLYNAVKALFAILFATVLGACDGNDLTRGDDALRIGDYDRAVTNFSKVLDAEPANRDARYGLALSYYAEAEDAERLKDSSFARWNRTAHEFKILSALDSSGICTFWTSPSNWTRKITLATT